MTPGDRGALTARAQGRTIRGVSRYGKFILIELDCGILTIHLGMTGKLLFDDRAVRTATRYLNWIAVR